MTYRLVAIDLDGTLLSSDRSVSPANRVAVNACIAAGRYVVIATGRPYDIVRIHCEGVSLRGPQITYNGAVVYDPDSDRVLSQELLPPAEAAPVLAFLREWNVPAVACGLTHVYLDARVTHPADWIPSPATDVQVLSVVRDIPADGLIKIVGESDAGTISRIRPIASATFRASLYVTQTAPSLIEFLNPSASKGAALSRIARSLGVGREEILAFGDSHNDLTMFQVAGRSVAMGNASDEVKDAADVVGPRNDEDGVAAILGELGLTEPLFTDGRAVGA